MPASFTPRRTLLLPVLVALALSGLTAPAAPAKSSSTTYKGKATNLAGDFNYGKVKATIAGGKLTSIKVESVSSTCSGMFMNRTYVYSSKDKTGKIVAGSTKVKKGKIVFNFKPDPDVDDTLMFNLRRGSTKLTGKIREVGVCTGAAKISAKR